jgi:uncharacterized protein
MIFHPQPLPESSRSLIAERFPAAQSILLQSADGTRLHAWHVKGVPAAPLVLYFGGNAEEVSWMLARAGAKTPTTAWLLVDYRGYGSSAGKPSESALVADAVQWYDHAKQKLGAQRIVLFGRSLGSGVAVQLAASRPVSGVILVAPFDSLTNVARHHYPYLPVRWMLRHRFESVERAPLIDAPLLCLAAEHDEIIPIVHAKRLFEAWKGTKRWVALRGAGHNSTDDAPEFWERIKDLLENNIAQPA